MPPTERITVHAVGATEVPSGGLQVSRDDTFTGRGAIQDRGQYTPQEQIN